MRRTAGTWTPSPRTEARFTAGALGRPVWPWGHLAVGYLAYAAVLDRRLRRPPGGLAVVVLAVATQLPDLVDKPLAWHLAVLPNGRSLAHSALVATVVVLLVGWALRARGDGDLAVAFGVGYYAHLAADAVGPILTGEWEGLAFLAWPLIPGADGLDSTGILEFFLALARDLAAGDVPPFFVAELGLVLLAAAVWASHGFPGLDVLRYGWWRRDRAPE